MYVYVCMYVDTYYTYLLTPTSIMRDLYIHVYTYTHIYMRYIYVRVYILSYICWITHILVWRSWHAFLFKLNFQKLNPRVVDSVKWKDLNCTRIPSESTKILRFCKPCALLDACDSPKLVHWYNAKNNCSFVGPWSTESLPIRLKVGFFGTLIYRKFANQTESGVCVSVMRHDVVKRFRLSYVQERWRRMIRTWSQEPSPPGIFRVRGYQI